ncbi:MAG: CRTAC1 family protein, partial [Saprospiraceae bacterium]|nr:CRTAC1 family protein [Saprospiraceae bacterium]
MYRDKLLAINHSLVMFSLLSFAMTSCQQSATRDTTLFSLRSTDHTQVTFSNTLIETDSLNMLTFTNFYTGSGVAIGDLNNDGLSDIFFGGNQVSSRLYINQRGLRFEDRTNSAGLVTDKWVTGVSLIDIDQDGFLDIYLSVSGPADREKNRNLLFINNGDLTFEESGKKYGLDDPSQSTHASFFDYDRDGDLDLFLAINPTDFALTLMGRAATRKVNGQAASTDKLFRNNGDGTFSDVSRVAGILYEGYSLGVNTSDFNNDGWVDIFISNDFATNDVLYINQHDGTFINQAADRLRHSSFASMGNDVADINNDGWQDLFVLDMYPEDNYREKMLVPTPNYNMFYYLLGLGYEPQYPRNVLQLNNGNGTFSEIGQMSGLSKTDWSWSALFADYDNDGLKDLYVTNGFTRDLGNLDFLNYNENSPFVNPNASPALHYQSIVNQDGTKIPNYAFMNKGDLTFEKVSSSWGLEKPSFSNGCAYGDLDGDGDLELVVSNINESAFIYENHSDQTGHHYLDLQLEGPDQNLHALGAKVKIRAGGKSQFHEHNIYRGYLSSVDQMIHFGLDTISVIDSIEVTWPDGSVTEFTDVKANQRHVISYKSGHSTPPINSVSDSDLPFAVFRDSALESYVHHDNPSRDFFIQPL